MARYYTHPETGNKLPSVTTVCGQLDKPGLMYWAANSACDYIIQNLKNIGDSNDIYPIVESARKNFRKVSAQAMDIGSAVHQAIEHYLKTGQEPQSPSDEVLSAFVAFLEWLDTWGYWNTLKTEHTLYGDDYAGTCDWIVYLEQDTWGTSKKYIIDFKTYNESAKTKPPYEEVRYQTAAYRACDDSIQGNAVLYLGKSTGKPLFFDLSKTYKDDLEVFKHLLSIYNLRHPF